MKTTIYCKPTSKGIHSFYLLIGTEEFFLFSQATKLSGDGGLLLILKDVSFSTVLFSIHANMTEMASTLSRVGQ